MQRYSLLMTTAIAGSAMLSCWAEDAAPQVPAGWLGSRAGVTDRVPKPWTPVTYDDGTFGVSLRTYALGDLMLPEQITATGEELLASPVWLDAVADGVLQHFERTSLKPAPRTKARCAVEFAAEGDRLGVEGRIEVEFDGLMTVSYRLHTQDGAPVRLDELAVVIPMKRECARYMDYFPGVWGNVENARTVPEDGIRIPFKPCFWLGNEDRGLTLVAKSDQGFHPLDRQDAITVAFNGDVALLCLHIVREPWEGFTSAEYEFALQATPVKPVTEDVWDMRICHHGDYGIESRPPLEQLAELGVRTIVFHEHWTGIQNYTTTSRGDDLRSLVAACHANGIKLLLYFGYEMSNIAPEWGAYSEQCLVQPRAGGYHRQPEQNAYIVCYESPWVDFMADGIAKVMDEYDIDGVYLDGTAAPWACANRAHGCGYVAPDGTVRPTYGIRGAREMMMRIYNIVRGRKPDGLVNVHESMGIIPPTMSFATSYWDGEQLGGIDRGKWALDVLPLDAFRAEFMGRNYGIPAELLCYDRPYTYREAMSFALLHDILVRGSLGSGLELESKLWQAMEDFGRKEAEFIPYWSERPAAATGSAAVLTSAYSRGRRGALLVVTNLGPEAVEATVTLDRERLGLPDGVPLAASDALNGDALPMEGDAVRLRLGSLDFTVVHVAPGA